MRWICLLGLQVAVEGKGWMVLAIDNYDSTGRRAQLFEGRSALNPGFFSFC